MAGTIVPPLTDDLERVLLDAATIKRRVDELARQVSADSAQADQLLVVGVLKGAFFPGGPLPPPDRRSSRGFYRSFQLCAECGNEWRGAHGHGPQDQYRRSSRACGRRHCGQRAYPQLFAAQPGHTASRVAAELRVVEQAGSTPGVGRR